MPHIMAVETLSRSLAAKEVFRTLQSLIMQLILISTAITRGSGLNFSLIFLHFICWYKYWMQAATSAWWLGLDSPVQKSNYTLQNLTRVGQVSVNIAFHNSRRRHYFQHTFSHLLHIGHFPSQQNRRWSSLQFVCDVACRYYILSLLLLPGAGLACFSKLNFSFATRILICSPLPPAPGR